MTFTTSTTACEEELILKRDRLGRVRMQVEKRELILDRFESSGMSGAAFAAQVGVKYQTFASWVQKRRRARGNYPNKGGEAVKTPLSLLEAIVEPVCDEGAGVEVVARGGVTLRVRDRSQVALAVELLRGLEGC